MNEELRIKLLGPPAAFVEDEPVSGFVSIKAQALLFYLAATGISHRRDALAALLWSDVPDSAARKNLRDVLSNLRRLIGPFLIITRHAAGLDPDAPVLIDSRSLLNTLTAVRDIAASPAPQNAIQTLADAADPRQGEFLAGFYPPDAPLFEEWMLAERERLQLELGNALESLTEYSLAFGEYAAAETYARRQLELNSYHEEAHRQLLTTLALSDRRAEAMAHYAALVDLLWNELGLEPAQKTQELIAKIQAGETIPTMFAEKTQPPPDNLSESLTPFVGRETELAAIAAQLAAPNSRLLTLHGPGGAGKTRLALEFARRQRGQYAQGIFFIPLASLTSPANLVTTIAGTIGLQLRPSPKPLKQLLRFLQSCQMLLLLDNFEHLTEGAGLLIELLQAAPEVNILVTSRDRLQLSAESIFEVNGLRTASAGKDVAEKEPEAVQMFKAYARRICHDFQPDNAGRTAVADLCRLVEGMPLAIELAAALVRTISPVEILEQIAVDSRLLEAANVDVPPRLHSVRASFNYSWGLLNEYEQQALMRLSVFKGGCTIASVEEIAGADSEILATLVDKSMLIYDPSACRYFLHELIRQLGEKRLQDSGNETVAYRKHAAHFLSHAHRAWVEVERDGGWEAYYKKISSELDNCRAAFQRSLAIDETETALQLATALAEYLIDHALRDEAFRSLEEALIEDGERSPAAIRANAYLVLSYAWTQLGGNRKAMIEHAEKGLALYQAIENQEGVARALFYCGYAYAEFDWDRARAYLKQSIEVYEDAGIEPRDSVAVLGVVEIVTGNLEKARSLIARRRAIHEKQADESGLIRTDSWIAFIHYYEGRFDEAQRLAERSLQYRRTHGPTEEDRIIPLDVLTHIALHNHQLDRAQELLRERLRILVDKHIFSNALRCFDEVAEWLFLNGQPNQAAFWLGCFDQAYEWSKTPIEPVNLPHYQWLVSEICDALGEEAYTDAWQKGYNVPVEDALPLALQVIEQTISKGMRNSSSRF